MNDNVVLPFCQFPTQRPVTYEWLMEFVEACNMNASEFAVLSRILSKVQKFDTAMDTWDNTGYCSLSIQSIADTWGMSIATVRNAIKCLELSGIITVQHSRGRSSNTITLTPHTEWVVTDFRELREIVKGKRSPSPIAHVTDTDTTPTPDTDATPNTVTVSNGKKQLPILKPKLDAGTDTNGYRHNAYANNIPSSVIGSQCPEDIKAKYCKRAPVTDVDAVTPLTVHVMDTSGNVVDTVTLPTNTDADAISKGKSRKSRKRRYSPSPNQYADNADDDELPVFNMSYAEYRLSELWHRK